MQAGLDVVRIRAGEDAGHTTLRSEEETDALSYGRGGQARQESSPGCLTAAQGHGEVGNGHLCRQRRQRRALRAWCFRGSGGRCIQWAATGVLPGGLLCTTGVGLEPLRLGAVTVGARQRRAYRPDYQGGSKQQEPQPTPHGRSTFAEFGCPVKGRDASPSVTQATDFAFAHPEKVCYLVHDGAPDLLA